MKYGLIIFAILLCGCWIPYDKVNDLNDATFVYYNPNFEKQFKTELEATSLRFDGIYYNTNDSASHEESQLMNYIKFFKNGILTVSNGLTKFGVEGIGTSMNYRGHAYGFYKFFGDTIVAELRWRGEGDKPHWKKYIIKGDTLIEFNSRQDTSAFYFHYNPKASIYPIEDNFK